MALLPGTFLRGIIFRLPLQGGCTELVGSCAEEHCCVSNPPPTPSSLRGRRRGPVAGEACLVDQNRRDIGTGRYEGGRGFPGQQGLGFRCDRERCPGVPGPIGVFGSRAGPGWPHRGPGRADTGRTRAEAVLGHQHSEGSIVDRIATPAAVLVQAALAGRAVVGGAEQMRDQLD